MENISSICTYVFAKNNNEEICTLIGKRTSTAPTGANLYTPPMGMVEKNENPYDAAVRECFEETGIKLPKNNLIMHDKENYNMRGKLCTGINFYILLNGDIDDYTVGEGDGENEKFIWLPLSKKNNIKWAFNTYNKLNEIIPKLNTTNKLTESHIKQIVRKTLRQYLQL